MLFQNSFHNFTITGNHFQQQKIRNISVKNKTLRKHLDYKLFNCEVWTSEIIQMVWFRLKPSRYLNQQDSANFKPLLKNSEVLLFHAVLWNIHHGQGDHFKNCPLWQRLQSCQKKKKGTTLSRVNYKCPFLHTINTNTHLHSKPFNLLVTNPFMPGIHFHSYISQQITILPSPSRYPTFPDTTRTSSIRLQASSSTSSHLPTLKPCLPNHWPKYTWGAESFVSHRSSARRGFVSSGFSWFVSF